MFFLCALFCIFSQAAIICLMWPHLAHSSKISPCTISGISLPLVDNTAVKQLFPDTGVTGFSFLNLWTSQTVVPISCKSVKKFNCAFLSKFTRKSKGNLMLYFTEIVYIDSCTAYKSLSLSGGIALFHCLSFLVIILKHI